jgi:hypothetical protein
MEYGLVNGKNPVAGIQECLFTISHTSTVHSPESQGGSMTDENYQQCQSNFSKVGLTFMDGPV